MRSNAGHWVGMTLYPITKCTPARAADMIEIYGTERIMVNSAGDWGHSDPLAVPEFIFEMRRRGHDEALIRKVVYDNPLAFFSQCARLITRLSRSRRGGLSTREPRVLIVRTDRLDVARSECLGLQVLPSRAGPISLRHSKHSTIFPHPRRGTFCMKLPEIPDRQSA